MADRTGWNTIEEWVSGHAWERANAYLCRLGLRPEDATDAAQDVLMWIVSKSREQGASGEWWEARGWTRLTSGEVIPPDEYLLGACRNRMLNWARSNRRRQAAMARSECLIGRLLGPVEAQEDDAQAAGLKQCLEKLDPRSKRIVHLTFAMELSRADVASSERTSVIAIKRVLGRAMAMLRRCLDQYLAEPVPRASK